jgi:uncharacterized protein (DUF4415 family)
MKTAPPEDFDDNPEWTVEDFASARPASQVLPTSAVGALRRPGRPIGAVSSSRKQVTLRLPLSVIEHFKAAGPGWQTRAVAVLERESRRGGGS